MMQAPDTETTDTRQEVADSITEKLTAYIENTPAEPASQPTHAMTPEDQEAMMLGTAPLKPIPYRLDPDGMAKVTDPTLIHRAIASAEADNEMQWAMVWKQHLAALNTPGTD